MISGKQDLKCSHKKSFLAARDREMLYEEVDGEGGLKSHIQF